MTAQSSFWARRRAAVQAEAEADTQAEQAALATARRAELAEQDDAAVLEEMGLPDPDGMKAGDDFAAFMTQEVPKHLQNRALRKLWRSNPLLACVDGLNDYDDDYRAAMLAGGPIQTAYQVGKGMLKHIEEVARQEEAARLEAEAPAEEGDDAEAESDDIVALDEEDTAPEQPVPALAVLAEAEDAPEDLAPRRMRFRFEEART